MGVTEANVDSNHQEHPCASPCSESFVHPLYLLLAVAKERFISGDGEVSAPATVDDNFDDNPDERRRTSANGRFEKTA
jgi:hypothetical protein